jgi:hypothetical protein
MIGNGPRSVAFLDPLRRRDYVSDRYRVVDTGGPVVIANCPSCGTHYKHEPPSEKVRARCGRCDTPLDLTRLRPYRIVPAIAPTPEEARRAASHLPIGLDHPALATVIAHNVGSRTPDGDPPPRPVPVLPGPQARIATLPEPAIAEVPAAAAPSMWHDLSEVGVEPTPVPKATQESTPGPEGARTTFALWLAAGTIAGTGVSWTVGGTTIAGIAAGAGLGTLAGWAWLRWMSPK